MTLKGLLTNSSNVSIALTFLEQAELKLKIKGEQLVKEQKDALNWAQEILEKTEPHAKQDILKFKQKIEAIEKEIKGQERILMASKMEYDDVKEQFHQHRDSKKGIIAHY